MESTKGVKSGEYLNKDYEYCYNKTVKTPFLKKLSKDMMPAPLWSEKLNMFANNPISQMLLDTERHGRRKWQIMKVHEDEAFFNQVLHAYLTHD